MFHSSTGGTTETVGSLLRVRRDVVASEPLASQASASIAKVLPSGSWNHAM